MTHPFRLHRAAPDPLRAWSDAAMFWDLNVAWDAKRAGAFADLALRLGMRGESTRGEQ